MFQLVTLLLQLLQLTTHTPALQVCKYSRHNGITSQQILMHDKRWKWQSTKNTHFKGTISEGPKVYTYSTHTERKSVVPFVCYKYDTVPRIKRYLTTLACPHIGIPASNIKLIWHYLILVVQACVCNVDYLVGKWNNEI